MVTIPPIYGDDWGMVNYGFSTDVSTTENLVADPTNRKLIQNPRGRGLALLIPRI